ncbi:MAG: hypothetical protein ACK5JD_08330 [Mangrovibacterium sp.]
MNRREAFKGLVALGTVALIPGAAFRYANSKPNLHFVGLGSGGTNTMWHIHQKGIEGIYTCFTGPYVSHLSNDVKHIYFEYPPELRMSNEIGRQRMPLTREMRTVLSGDEHYVITVGLGAFSGTSLISDTLEFLEATNKSYLAVCTLPFKTEGRWRNEYARQKMKELKNNDKVLFSDQEQIKKIFEELSILETFEMADEQVFRIVKKHCLS